MALDTKMSCLVAALSFVISISCLHLIKSIIVDMPAFYILIGIYGGILCVVLLTAVNNLENLFFGNEFYAQLFPEVFLCILVTSFSVGSVHRICGTVCFLTSCACCYFLNRMSQQVYSSSATAPVAVVTKRKRT